MDDVHTSSILTVIHTCCVASSLRLLLPMPLLLKSLHHPIIIVSSNYVQSERLKSVSQESQLLGHCSEMMVFPLDTLAEGTNYVDEFSKSAENLCCQQLWVILIHRFLEGCYVQRVKYDDAFAFSGLGSARCQSRNSDGGVRIANFARSCLP